MRRVRAAALLGLAALASGCASKGAVRVEAVPDRPVAARVALVYPYAFRTLAASSEEVTYVAHLQVWDGAAGRTVVEVSGSAQAPPPGDRPEHDPAPELTASTGGSSRRPGRCSSRASPRPGSPGPRSTGAGCRRRRSTGPRPASRACASGWRAWIPSRPTSSGSTSTAPSSRTRRPAA